MQALHEALQLAGTVLLTGMVIGLIGMTAHITQSASLPPGNSNGLNTSSYLPASCASPVNTFHQPLWFNLECGE